jgi:hypothetical protein
VLRRSAHLVTNQKRRSKEAGLRVSSTFQFFCWVSLSSGFCSVLRPIGSLDPQSRRTRSKGGGEYSNWAGPIGAYFCGQFGNPHSPAENYICPYVSTANAMSGASSDQGPGCVSAARVLVPGARIPASLGAPGGLQNDGRDRGRGDPALRGTCRIFRDGVGRGLARWDPSFPVVAVVWPGGPSSRWGAVRWVSASSVLWNCCVPALGRSELNRWCLGVEEPGLGTGPETGRHSRPPGVQTQPDPRLCFGSSAPNRSWSGLVSGSSSSSPTWRRLGRCTPPPPLGPPRLSGTTRGHRLTSGSL